MPAATKNLQDDDVLEAGSTFTRVWQLMNTETGLPHDLTSYTSFESSFRQTFDDVSAAFTATVTITDASTGIITYVLDADDLTTWATGKSESELSGVWDLEGYTATTKIRFLRGAWSMTPEATLTGD